MVPNHKDYQEYSTMKWMKNHTLRFHYIDNMGYMYAPRASAPYFHNGFCEDKILFSVLLEAEVSL